MTTHTNPNRPADRQTINQRNAQHSTGPRTPEGKQRVSRNALKHGLTAKDILMSEGEAESYDNLLAQMTTKWRPATEEERDIVLSLRDAQWRLDSIPVLQINLGALATEEQMEAFAHIEDAGVQRSFAQIAGYRANAKLFDQLSRHEGRLQRTIRGLEARLTEMTERRKEDAEKERREKQNQANAQNKANPQSAPQTQTAKQTQPTSNPAAKQTHFDSPAARERAAELAWMATHITPRP